MDQLVPIARPRQRRLGMDVGRYTVPDDFNDPLPPEVLAGFE